MTPTAARHPQVEARRRRVRRWRYIGFPLTLLAMGALAALVMAGSVAIGVMGR